MADFLAEHFQHSRPTITFPMTAAKYIEAEKIGEVIPSNLEYNLSIDEVSTITYELPMEHILSRWHSTEPYYTDFAISRNGVPLISGLHTGIAFKPGSGMLSVAGKSWKHWFERRVYPFDLPDVAADFDATFTRVATDTIEIAWDLIEETSLNALYTPPTYTYVGVMVTQSGTLPTSGLSIDYLIPYADEQDILSKVNDLSNRYPGFDWDIDTARQFQAYTPYRGEDRTDLVLEEGINITDCSVNNDGLLASQTYATGSGQGQKVMKLGTHAGTSYFSRLQERFVDFGEIDDPAELQKLADGEDLRSVHGVETVTCKMLSENFDFFEELNLGDIVSIRIPTEYYYGGYLGGTRRIVNISGSVNNEGDEDITLTLDNSHEAF